MMLQVFKIMPGALQKQLLIRLGLGAMFVIILIALLPTTGDALLWLPCVGAAVFFALSTFLLLRRVVLGEYIVVDGTCTEVGATALKRRVKSIVLQTDAGSLKVTLHGQRRKIITGASVRLYIAKNSLIYEQNGSQALYSYIALEIM